MVLHTVEFESQDEILNIEDFNAAWLALSSMGDRYMVIFNGGKDAGASLNHKHLQVLPRPEHGGLETLLEVANSESSREFCHISLLEGPADLELQALRSFAMCRIVYMHANYLRIPPVTICRKCFTFFVKRLA